ncbi:uncharacterized protein NEMAJ01_1026 [Nematocida major]|uniref:uncharacterized protein n=1 Tax=Nematocida major TaxID=1912982 RepID=UPI002008846A|nr:uncharacterized protein NEMAJ01_1026 [Nematocida major]KAH9386130.1 hypothetical protein NEMAJ01_1026 [Nematocida major]
MEDNQHIDLNICKLKLELLQDTANSKVRNPTDAVLNALSSRIKESLRNIPEEKRAEIRALVDTFLLKELEPALAKIISTPGVASPNLAEILTKEAILEASSELTRKLSRLNAKVDAFVLSQEILYEEYVQIFLTVNIRMFRFLEETYTMIVSYCKEALQKEAMKNFDISIMRDALNEDVARLKDTSAVLQGFEQEMKSSEVMLRMAVGEKEKCKRENILDFTGYAFKRADEKARAYFSRDRLQPSVYFGLKGAIEENSDYIPSNQVMLLEKYGMNSPNVFSVGEMAEKLEKVEKECLRKGKKMCESIRKKEKKTVELMQDVDLHFKNMTVWGVMAGLVELSGNLKGAIEKMQGPEKTEMEKFRDDLKRFFFRVEMTRRSSFALLDALSRKIIPKNILMKLSGARVRNKFALFNDGFRKIQDKFPTGEIKSGYEKAFYALRSHPRTKQETAKQMHRNAMEAEEHLTRLRGIDEGTTRKDCDLRVAEYEKFARKTEMPDFSGAIENITRESLEDGVTLREIKAMLSNVNILHGICTEELEDEAKSESERVELKKSLSETEEKIRVLEERIRSFSDLSEEEAQREDCLRYAYLTKYKNECLKRIFTLQKEAEAEMAPLAREVMKEIEEIPNNPELSEKVEKMLEEIIEEEPHRLLTSESIIKNEHFLEEMPKLLGQLDREITGALKKTPGKGGRAALLRNSFIGFLIAAILISMRVIFNTRTEQKNMK